MCYDTWKRSKSLPFLSLRAHIRFHSLYLFLEAVCIFLHVSGGYSKLLLRVMHMAQFMDINTSMCHMGFSIENEQCHHINKLCKTLLILITVRAYRKKKNKTCYSVTYLTTKHSKLHFLVRNWTRKTQKKSSFCKEKKKFIHFNNLQ